MQVKAHAHAQAEAEQAEAGAHGERARWESGDRQVHAGNSGQRRRWASGMNPNNREISMSTKKKRGQAHAPNNVPAAEFILGSFGCTLFNPKGKGSTGQELRGEVEVEAARGGGCRQVVGCIQQVEVSGHGRESRGRQVCAGNSRQRRRWASGVNANNRETRRGPSDICPENEELNWITYTPREEERGAKVLKCEA